MLVYAGAMNRSRLAIAFALALLACSSGSREERPAPAARPPAPPAVERVPETPDAAAGTNEVAPPPAQVASSDQAAPYRGQHKLGVNRVTDMARTGMVTFALRDGDLIAEGRVARGQHWLSLQGKVEPRGERAFELVGAIEGVPDMAWAGEPLRQRRTEGRFLFEVRKGRPYFRLYELDGRECVCQADCGNDFCYIDIEVAESDP